MNWFKEIPISHSNYKHSNIEDLNYLIKPLDQSILSVNPDFINDIVLQWIIVPFIINNDVVYSIPVNEPALEEYTYTTLNNLFDLVRGVYVDGKLVEIKLEKLKQQIKNSFTELVLDADKTDPLVKDFYLKEKIDNSNQFDIKLFEVDIDNFIELTTYCSESNHLSIWEFFIKSYLSNEITLFPTNWVFNDRLLESPFLIFLSRYANEVILTVNLNDLNVRAVTFKVKRQST